MPRQTFDAVGFKRGCSRDNRQYFVGDADGT
jgi:hypothetical protein